MNIYFECESVDYDHDNEWLHKLYGFPPSVDDIVDFEQDESYEGEKRKEFGTRFKVIRRVIFYNFDDDIICYVQPETEV